MPTIWMALILLFLVLEFIKMELYGACGAVGALGGLIAYFVGLSEIFQVLIAILLAAILVVTVRPVGMKYIHRMKKESASQKMIGCDAIVISTIDNSQGLGIVSVNGRNWSAKSHRANAIIPAGTLVKVVAANKNMVVVDDRKRNYSNNT